MNGTLRYKYVRLLQTRLPLYKRPIGTMMRIYMRPVIPTCFRPSSSLVVRARICVAMAEKNMCQHVRNIAVSSSGSDISGGEGSVKLEGTDGMLAQNWNISKEYAQVRIRGRGWKDTHESQQCLLTIC